ncbi:uncharacterized protein LOC130648222 [Hydractinia symbiolongicarpus]|uniref:uncharacterized protein LOC130648222 n=1 Tax=Hydractinia symbiolongicarpus TaxID=13093 RepID=UPI00254EC09B|nr:uncharacterized protein LOC130648222 [Hydractinia symbiolongicarpus]
MYTRPPFFTKRVNAYQKVVSSLVNIQFFIPLKHNLPVYWKVLFHGHLAQAFSDLSAQILNVSYEFFHGVVSELNRIFSFEILGLQNDPEGNSRTICETVRENYLLPGVRDKTTSAFMNSFGANLGADVITVRLSHQCWLICGGGSSGSGGGSSGGCSGSGGSSVGSSGGSSGGSGGGSSGGSSGCTTYV